VRHFFFAFGLAMVLNDRKNVSKCRSSLFIWIYDFALDTVYQKWQKLNFLSNR